ncbi:hypothetical protein [Gemella cuniculi]|uniref:hypothetical protein n=1 Tax=Gemella cuniculi TaxID=150240 RepID=UPI00041C0065|nr:hypothetical protein [Gemella cuniculi]
MNKGLITKEEYNILKKYAPKTMKYVFFEEKEEYINIYFSDYDELAVRLTSDIISNNINNKENNDLKIAVDEILNQICERMYYY